MSKQIDLLADIKRGAEHTAAMVTSAEELCRMVNHAVALASVALDVLNDLTTDQFRQGGDRPARAALVEILARAGVCPADLRREYRCELLAAEVGGAPARAS